MKRIFQKYGVLLSFMLIFAILDRYMMKLKSENNELGLKNIVQESLILNLNRKLIEKDQKYVLDSLSRTMDDVLISPLSRHTLDSIRRRNEYYNKFSATADSAYIQLKFAEHYSKRARIQKFD